MNKQTEEFIDILKSFKTKKDVYSFMKLIFSSKEMVDIPKRLKIIKMLNKGVNQRIISQKTGAGIATVTRGSKELLKNEFKNINNTLVKWWTRSRWRD